MIYALLPVAAIFLGSIITFFKKPGIQAKGAILHFAAGVVFSVAAVELLPDIVKEHSPLEVAIGFGFGIFTMLMVKRFNEKIESGNQIQKSVIPLGLLITIGVDLVLDGLLLGVGFAAGQKEGVMLSLALTIEVFSLGIALSISLSDDKFGRGKILKIIGILAVSFIIGAVLGITLLKGLPKEILELVLSFGLAALLYLVTEELLVEAHEEKEGPFQTAFFFVGFLLFLILGMVA